MVSIESFENSPIFNIFSSHLHIIILIYPLKGESISFFKLYYSNFAHKF